ncbi:RHS repeat-associated core domain-containing protein [Actinomadura rupiterrae]|uniref:RHS repeat-associated core domain-containing protein n=1 Tax=Actinomadura rupiterrae TaxID=559627 RepID=UPI0020A5BD2E|nr:RHS repeat-associated core domain-containing protein [Actinomadura rupiterrae]MCP2343147.1 RHS repeat-associated protein [Actinomadura rupiterrae]
MSTGLVSALPAQAQPPHYNPVDQERVVQGHKLTVKPRRLDDALNNPAPAPRTAWPKSGTAEVDVPKAAGLDKANRSPAARAGDLPVSVTAPAARPGLRSNAHSTQTAGKVQVRVLDRHDAQRAGVNGLVFSVGRSDAPTAGQVGVQLDYSAFDQAFGGSYGSRLRLVQLPGCALSTPERPECRTTTPLAAANNTQNRTLAGTVDAAPVPSGPQQRPHADPHTTTTTASAAGPTVLAAVSGTGGDQGDYKATALSPSATWQVGTQTGDFNWSYPMRVPPVPGGLAPDLKLSYSSASIDGRTSNANNQSSWAGDGFELWPGYIERKYKACKDDGVPKDEEYNEYPADQCWGYDNASISFAGQGGELIPAGGDRWRLKKDDGTRIQKLTSSTTDNGDNDGEYWKVTTPNGTTYYFGLNTLAAGKTKTNSTWTTPVFGDDDGEPCHKDAFKDSWCQQAYRWNLDKVVDSNGNAVTYFYQQEKNHYGRNLRAKKETEYVRGGYLERAEYGLRNDDLFPAKGAPARVDFNVSERCIRDTAADCAEANIKDHPAYWEDVPWDLHCDQDQECKDEHGSVSPSFWSRKRLTNVTTKILNNDGTGYRSVDSWDLKHAWSNGDVDRQLLLESVTTKGLATTPPVTLPPVTFIYTQKENRVDKLGDDDGPFVKSRLGTVYTETGGQLDINYTDKDCTPGDLPAEADNHRRCFPVYRMKSTGTDENPTLDWFHKYAVAQIVQTDLTGGAPDTVTDYSYSKPAWHFDDDQGLQPDKYKTWSQFHGFSRVRTITRGGTGGTDGQSDTWYFQGMDGDRADKEGKQTKTPVPVPADAGDAATYDDHESLQGLEALTIKYDKAGGTPVTKTAVEPWHKQTASRTGKWGTVTADFVAQRTQTISSLIDGDKWRRTQISNKEFDEVTGKPVVVENLGDTDPQVTNDDRCTTTSLVHNTTDWLVGFTSEVKTVAARCGEKADYTKQLVSASRSTYDGKDFGQPPSRGLVTQTDKVSTATTVDTLVYVPEGRSKFDDYGRPTATTVVDNTTKPATERTTTTTYTDTNGLNTAVKTTTPPAVASDATTAQVTTKTYDPAWAGVLTDTDAGGQVTHVAYDALGRTAKVWGPNRTTSQTPTSEYEYLLSPSHITTIVTKTLNNDDQQDLSYTLYDGWLRTRQTQAPGPDNGRVISDTFYTARGKPAKTYDPYYADGAPTSTLFGVDKAGDVETQRITEYDGLDRVTTQRLRPGNTDQGERWKISYAYTGNTVTVTPPDGGTPVTTVTDALGRTVEMRQHWTQAVGFSKTTYTYNAAGSLASVVAPGGSTFTNTYDVRGRKTTATSPDSGTVRYTYNDIDQLTQTEDPRTDSAGRTRKLQYTYDGLGRQRVLSDATAGTPGTKLAEWTYDTVRKGQRTASIRYDGTQKYTFRNKYFDAYNRTTQANIQVEGLPDAEKSLVPTNGYTLSTTYNLDGTVKTTGLPAAGGLPAEAVSYSYDALGRPTTTQSNLSSYVVRTDYSKTSKLLGLQMATSATGKKADVSYTYEYGTQRLRNVLARHDGAAGYDSSADYSYNDAGAVTQIADTSRDGIDNQCFQYDYLQRLTDAWTQNTPAGTKPTCADDPARPTQVALGGPAPYRYHYDYDVTGNRTKEAKYGSTGLVEAERSYTYAPGNGADGKQVNGHQLASVTRTGQTKPEETYAYDVLGNTTTRNTASGEQKLNWDTEGRLTKITDSRAGETTFGYDTAGQRFLRRDPTGATLYLPGQEVRLDKGATTPKAVRYYQHADGTVASRTSEGKVTFLLGDHHGTAEIAVNSADGTYARRRHTPFGAQRGNNGTWPALHEGGFVGGTRDPSTGLTHLGARDYDPNTGRFISRDPVIDDNDPQQLNGYAYSNNNPTNLLDPSGLWPWNYIWNALADPGSYDWSADYNFIGGWFDGTLQSFIDPFLQLYNMPGEFANANAKIVNTVTGKPTVPEVEPKKITVHVSGADPDTKMYKAGHVGGEVLGIPIPGAAAGKALGALKGLRELRESTKFEKALAAARGDNWKPFSRGDAALKDNVIHEIGEAAPGRSTDEALADLDSDVQKFTVKGYEKGQKKTRVYVGALNTKTRQTVIANSGTLKGCAVTRCAEGHSFNIIVEQLGGDPADIRFTRAWTLENYDNVTKTGPVGLVAKLVCAKCQLDFPEAATNFGDASNGAPEGFWWQTGQQ